MAETPTTIEQVEPAKTGRQTGSGGVATALFELPGFREPSPGTYSQYRKISKHPTVALAKALLTGPIMCTEWTFKAREGIGKEEHVKFVHDALEYKQAAILEGGLRYFEYGWQPAEKVWRFADGSLELDRLKWLLPDITTLAIRKDGQIETVDQGDAKLRPEQFAVFTYDGECDNHYGCSRYENVREVVHKWKETSNKSHQLATKVASIIPLVHYPDGESSNAQGQTKSNYELATELLQGLSQARGIALPNLLANSVDASRNPELAGKSQWLISFLEAAGAAANLSSMTDRERYYDSLIIRGMLLPERSAIEAQTAGSRADSQTGADSAILQSVLLHKNFCHQLTQNTVRYMLAFKYGNEYADAVCVEPTTLDPEVVAIFRKILEGVINSDGAFEEFLQQLDANAMMEALEIPVAKGKTFSFSDYITPPKPNETPIDPKADQLMQDTYGRQGGGSNERNGNG